MNETTTHFYELGRQAYRNGEHRAPALNAEVRAATDHTMVGDPIVTQVMSAYSAGYDYENELEVIAVMSGEPA